MFILYSSSSLDELIFFIVFIIKTLNTTKVIIPIMSCACGVTSTITQSTNTYPTMHEGDKQKTPQLRSFEFMLIEMVSFFAIFSSILLEQ